MGICPCDGIEARTNTPSKKTVIDAWVPEYTIQHTMSAWFQAADGPAPELAAIYDLAI